ncbi:10621_t:CDS:2, partial [Dentiscutata heterogama]
EVIYFPAVRPELTVQFIGNLKDFKDSDIEEWVQRISPFKFLHIRKKPEELMFSSPSFPQ